MSTSVNSLILVPGSTSVMYCKDGLSPIDVNHIKKFFNFGGNVVFNNCGASTQFSTLWKAKADMKEHIADLFTQYNGDM